MGQTIPEPTLWIFLLQAILFVLPIPLSILAYQFVQESSKTARRKDSLSRLGVPGKMYSLYNPEHSSVEYIWPVLLSSTLTLITYGMAHVYPIQLGLGAGFLEEVIDIFGANNPFPRPISSGRIIFFGWLGAWIYSVHLIYRRFLAYDLTPSVYIFVANRFILATVVGCMVGIAVGTYSTAANISFDVNMATVAVIVFFIGFFPEQGVNWITAFAAKKLGHRGGIAKESRLSEIEGLSVWRQGRLRQESIDNVQNLATADIPALILSTPFPVEQIVDWVNQAVLLVYASDEQFRELEKVGLRCATDVITAASDSKQLNQMTNATGLNEDGLRMLRLALQSAPNVEAVSRIRWQSSLDKDRREEAAAVHPHQYLGISSERALPREQEAIMFEEEQDLSEG